MNPDLGSDLVIELFLKGFCLVQKKIIKYVNQNQKIINCYF